MSLYFRFLSIVLLVALLGAGGWALWQQELIKLPSLPFLNQLEISTPGPLRSVLNQPGRTLTRSGILIETNRHRQNEGREALVLNEQLNQAAERKVQDMFAQQYFEHVGPDGKGPADWVEGVGYQYLRVGENLALGNFASDAALVQAWMDSPGHRENIISPRFTQIGIAAAVGTFEGQRTWLAVQTFALPQSACPAPETAVEKRFTTAKEEVRTLDNSLKPRAAEIQELQAKLNEQRTEIDQLVREGNAKIEAGNQKIAEGNRIYKETGSREQAQPYWDEGERQQAEGEDLLRQAQQKQADYNQATANFNDRRDAYNTEVDKLQQLQGRAAQYLEQLNQQIRTFNTCLAQ